MNKIFIACPISKYLDGNNFTDAHFKVFIERLFRICRNYTQYVFLALEREEYGKNLMLEQCTELDYKEMADTDVVIAIPDDSLGVAVEIGWAAVMKKEILLVLEKQTPITPLISGIGDITRTTIIQYEDVLDYKVLSKIDSYLLAAFNNQSGQ